MKWPQAAIAQGKIPPGWFFEIRSAIRQGKQIDNSPSIRRQPIYLTQRFDLVFSLLSEARLEMARSSKAMPVFDLSDIS